MKGYNNLKREFKKIWDMPVKVIPAVVGALHQDNTKEIKAAVK